jgi:hypothetical protein
MHTNWSRKNRNWSDLPKKNPGPGEYNHEVGSSNRHAYNAKGNAFALSPLEDPVEVKKIRDRFPGPGTYEAAPLKVGHMKKILGGPLEEIVKDEQVPGPGAYKEKSTLLHDAPGFVIKPAQA